MDLLVKSGGIQAEETDAIVVNLFEGVAEPGGATGAVDKALNGAIRDLIAGGDLRGKLNETAIFHPRGAIPARRVVVVGLGPEAELSLDGVRQAAAAAARKARDAGARRLASIVHGGGRGGLALVDAAQAVVEGTVLGLYRYAAPGVMPREEAHDVDLLALVESDAARLPEVEVGARVGRAVAAGACLARDLANRPANVATPTALAEEARRIAAEYGMACQILDREHMAELKMGALLSVARGASEPPKFIVLEHTPAGTAGDAPPFVLVGKGITFDSGGISIKPGEGMEEMRGDMSGAAAVLGTLQAAGAIGLPRRVVGIIPATENMPSGTATHPGDVVAAMNGVTIEVINTDAEGRLILADALAYAQRYNPTAVIDMATLTGAVIVALGHLTSGVYATEDSLWEAIRAAGAASGEPMWRMPLDPAYDEQIKTPFADVKNTGGRPGGSITAARFLTRFVGKHPWAHIDIAGTDWWGGDPANPKKPYYLPGSRGVGVGTLVGVLRTWGA